MAVKQFLKLFNENFKIVLILFIFVLGLLFCVSYKSTDFEETFTIMDKCPNLLIKKGKELFLLNTKKTQIPGVNPIKFNNLEEYAEFVKYQKYMNINCPVLYYQETYNTQNDKGFRLMNDPLKPKNGLASNLSKEYDVNNIGETATKQLFDINDASHDNPPFNVKHFNGIDPTDQLVGIKTKLDNIKLDEVNPMSMFWKGDAATRKSIEKGDFVGRTRNMKDPFVEEKLLRQDKCN